MWPGPNGRNMWCRRIKFENWGFVLPRRSEKINETSWLLELTIHNVDRQACQRNPKKCWTGVMFEGLRTLIPLSNNLTLLLRLTSSSPGSGLQKNFLRTFFSKFELKLKLKLRSYQVFVTGPQKFPCKKGKFHIKLEKWNKCTLKSPENTGSDVIRQTARHKKQTNTFASPRGQHLVPAPIHPDKW